MHRDAAGLLEEFGAAVLALILQVALRCAGDQLAHRADPIEPLAGVVGSVARIAPLLNRVENLADEGVPEDHIAEGLPMHRLEDGVLVGAGEAELLQQRQIEVLNLLCRPRQHIQILPQRIDESIEGARFLIIGVHLEQFVLVEIHLA